MSDLSEYKSFVRNNLPAGMTIADQYFFVNDNRFTNYVKAEWYLKYLTKFGFSAGSLLAYAANSITPQLVADFKEGVYGKASALSTFDNVLNHTRNGNATMVDADGLLKWAPHNIILQSNAFLIEDWSGFNFLRSDNGNGSWTINNNDSPVRFMSPVAITASGDSLVFGIEAKPKSQSWISIRTTGFARDDFHWFDISNGAVGGQGFYPQTITPTSDGFYLCTVEIDTSVDKSGAPRIQIGSDDETVAIGTLIVRKARGYHSDLGGMVNNPATGDSYVPTTDAARYLPRENHHVYNGSAWGKEGYLHEPEAATNLATYSNDFSQWSEPAMATSGQTNSLTGEADATLLETTGGVNRTTFAIVNALENIETSLSIFAKAGTTDWLILYDLDYAQSAAWFDLASGAVGTVQTNASAIIEDLGGGWRRCSIKLKNPANYTPRLAIEVVTADGDGGATNGENIYLYGAQFEAGSVPTSYIPTAGSTVTRAADTLTLPVANIPYPEPVVIGPELVTNGDFSNGTTGWVDQGTSAGSVVAGSLVVTGGAGGVSQDRSVVAGSVYEVSFEYAAGTATSVSFRVGANGGLTGDLLAVQSGLNEGSNTGYFVASSSSCTIYMRNGTSGTANWDNISIREINPLAVSFGYKSLVTYADTNNGIEANFLAWNATSTEFISTRLNTQGSRTGQVVFYQRNDTQFAVDSSTAAYSPDINVPMSIASRHGSTFVNGAVDGTALTAKTTPVAFPDLSTTDLIIAPSGGPQIIQEFIMWGGTTGDIGDTGIAETSA